MQNSPLYRFGYSRDKRPDLRQVNFSITELRNGNIPIGLNVSPGNESDGKQFVDLLNGIMGLLKEDSTIVMDAASDNKNVIDAIRNSGHRHIVRKKMNVTDDKWISNFDKETAVLVDDKQKVWCRKRTFSSSGRTTYMFFSEKLYKDKITSLDSRAQRCVDANEVIRQKKDGTLRISRTAVKRLRNPLLSLFVGIQSKLLSTDDDSFKFVREELSNGREGFFKIESSKELTELDAYQMYRKRDTAEKLIESLKNHIDMGLLRVWSDHSVKGILTICFLAQMMVLMVRFEHTELSRSSTRMIIRSLEKLTLTVIFGAGKRRQRIFSNFEPVNSLVLGAIPPDKSYSEG